MTVFTFIGLAIVLILVGGAILYLIGMARDRYEPLWCFHSGIVCLGTIAMAIVIASVITWHSPTTHATTTTAMTAEKVTATTTSAAEAEKITAPNSSHESFFWVKFIGLTLADMAVAVGITYLIAWYNKGNAQEYLRNNNWPLYLGLGATIITFVIALFNFGPALLLPKDFPTQGQRNVASEVFNHILFGTHIAPAKNISATPLPWATGTWFWWKAWPIYLLLTLLYIPFGLHDEVREAIEKIRQLLREHHDRALAERQAAHAVAVAQAQTNKTTPPPPPPAKLSFWQFAKWDTLMELGFAVLRNLFKIGI